MVKCCMQKFHLDNRDPSSYIQIMIGLFVFAAGIVFILKSNLGVGPWDVFHVGITNHFPLTLGRVSQIVGFIIIVLSIFLSIYGWQNNFPAPGDSLFYGPPV